MTLWHFRSARRCVSLLRHCEEGYARRGNLSEIIVDSHGRLRSLGMTLFFKRHKGQKWLKRWLGPFARTFRSNLSVDSNFPYVSYVSLVSLVPITRNHIYHTSPPPVTSVTLWHLWRPFPLYFPEIPSQTNTILMHHIRILFQKNEYGIYALQTPDSYHKSPTKHTLKTKRCRPQWPTPLIILSHRLT